MNTKAIHFRQKPRRGLAILTVLMMTALMTVLMVTLISRSLSESRGSKTFSETLRLQGLTDHVLNVALRQIRAGSTPAAGSTWISQPGALHQYSGAGSGAYVKGFKLYSDSSMVGSSALDLTTDSPAADWNSEANQERYTDLNSPVSRSGRDFFPILDPTAQTHISGLRVTTGELNGASSTRAPMPVEWLYVLQDGTMKTWDDLSASLDESNPVTGRIAFWGDDESSKLNINTASDGVYWDTPRAAGDDKAYGLSQPSRMEFQRYPGHPALTSLTGVLFPENLTTAQREGVYALLPRVEPKGTRGGSVSYVSTGEAAVPDTNRLFENVDELAFGPALNAAGTRLGLLAAGELHPDSIAKSGVSALRPHFASFGSSDVEGTANLIEKSRFFTTAQSRSPELNLSGKPRIAIWPTADGRLHRSSNTTFDQLIKYCSTLGGHAYYFTRLDEDLTTDLSSTRNMAVRAYLQNLTENPVPGFGGNFLTKYGADRDQILTEIYDYIRCTNLYDDSLGSEYDGYTTSGANNHRAFTDGRSAQGHGVVAPVRLNDTHGLGRFHTISEAAVQFICTADSEGGENGRLGSNNPAVNNTLTTKLDPARKQRRIQALFYFEFFCPALGWNAINSQEYFKVTSNFDPSISSAAGAQTFGIPTKTNILSRGSVGNGWNERNWGGGTGYRGFLYNRSAVPSTTDASAANYRLISVPMTVDCNETDSSGQPVMDFSGASFDIEIWSIDPGHGSTSRSQTIKFRFPPGKFPVPKLVTTGTPAHYGSTSDPSALNSPATTAAYWWTFNYNGCGFGSETAGRLRHISQNPADPDNGNYGTGSLIREEDVVRSLVPSHGDYRHVLAQDQVPETLFIPHPDYHNTSKPIAHYLITSAGPHFVRGFSNYDKNNQLVPGLPAAYAKAQTPDFPGNTTGSAPVVWTTGDFDNGLSIVPDGAYINKPDEGNYYQIKDGKIPYFDINWSHEAGGPSYFSPNRMLHSPVMFGSLPSRVKAGIPWTTLLFRPQPTHSGAASPPDHLLLDLFWMPIVEPYAISETFSTAGKINLNYQIVPFSHIRRDSGLRALLKQQRMLVIPKTDVAIYKSTSSAKSYRKKILADPTLSQFEERFTTGNLFRAESEICDIHLVPEGGDLAAMKSGAFWQTNALTGDNSRERPYADLYPRLTTRSNSFRIHYKVQSIQLPRSSYLGGQLKVQVLAEAQGSTLVERYLDPADSSLAATDFATNLTAAALNRFYRYRFASGRRFR